MTHAVSRRQEFTADALAARVVGSRPLIDGLKLTYGAAYAFDAYWLNEVAPVLRHGFHPPLAEGFRRYLASPRIAAALSTSLDRELAESETNPYDTHPPIRARIAALQNQPIVKHQSLILLPSPCLKRSQGSKRDSSKRFRPNPQLRHRSWWLGTMLEGRSGPQPGRPTLENMQRFSLESPLAPSLNLLETSIHFQNAFGSPTGQTWQRRNAANTPLLPWV